MRSLCEAACLHPPSGFRVDKKRPDAQTTGPRLRPGPRYGDLVANTKSAEKAARQAEKHRARNVSLRSRMRTAVRGVTAAVASGDKEVAQKSYGLADRKSTRLNSSH